MEPLANVLLVKVKDAEDVSAGGIVLPDQVSVSIFCISKFGPSV